MATYQDSRAAAIATVQSLIYANGVQAITGPVHQTNEVNQVNDYYDNLVAYDGFNYRWIRVATSDNGDNAVALQAAYDAAKLLTPGGSPLSSTNRVCLILPPGTYAFGTGTLVVDTEFIDFLGLGATPEDVIIHSLYTTADGRGTVTKTADDVAFSNLTIHNAANTLVNTNSMDASAFAPQDTFVNELFVNVQFTVTDPTQAWPTRLQVNYAGTYTDCFVPPNSSYTFQDAPGNFTRVTAGLNAFQNASGNFTDCEARTDSWITVSGRVEGCRALGDGCFSVIQSNAQIRNTHCILASGFGSTEAGAVVEDCSAGLGIFQAGLGQLNGTHRRCTGGESSFVGTVLGGKFEDCTSDNGGFGLFASAALTGTFERCKGYGSCFGTGVSTSLSGTFIDCISGNNSFGQASATLSGTFRGCNAGNNSFGQQSSFLSGTFTNCVAMNQSFGYGASSATISTISGTFKNCHGSDDCFGRNSSITSAALFEYCSGRDRCFCQGATGLSGLGIAGTFRYCQGRDACFGAGMTATVKTSGLFEYCSGRNGCFAAGAGMEASGTFRNCIGGDGCFGYAANPGTGEAPVASGTFENCIGGDQCFGASDGDENGTEFNGYAKGCVAGEASFGSCASGAGDGLMNGVAHDCEAGYQSFGLQENGSGGMKGLMVNCSLTADGLIAVPSAKGIVTGRMENCQITVTDANTSAIVVASGAKLYGCTLIGTGTGYAVTGTGNASIVHCRGNGNGIDVTVTNTVASPNNVFDNGI